MLSSCKDIKIGWAQLDYIFFIFKFDSIIKHWIQCSNFEDATKLILLCPKGHCSGGCFEGLSFFGWFEEGIPKGPCYRSLVGGSYLYGIVDEKGEFTGTNDIAFIYQDLELALIGQFDKGIMVRNSFLIQVNLKLEILRYTWLKIPKESFSR